MELLIWTLAAAFLQYAVASHEHEGVAIHGYEAKLQELGQHVEIPEPPVKVIRITKTVAIKVPVPYPVKIPHNVPYPVHIAKPYPVPVPQIVKVPYPVQVAQQKPLVEPNIYSLHKAAPVWPSADDNAERSDYSGRSDESSSDSFHDNGSAGISQDSGPSGFSHGSGSTGADHGIVYGDPKISYDGGHGSAGQQHGFSFSGVQQHTPQTSFDGGIGSGGHGQEASYGSQQQHGLSYDAPVSGGDFNAGYHSAPTQVSEDGQNGYDVNAGFPGSSYGSQEGGNSYEAPQHTGHNSFDTESNAYDAAIQEYLKKYNINGGGSGGAPSGHGAGTSADSYPSSYVPTNSLGDDYRRVHQVETKNIDRVSYDH